MTCRTLSNTVSTPFQNYDITYDAYLSFVSRFPRIQSRTDCSSSVRETEAKDGPWKYPSLPKVVPPFNLSVIPHSAPFRREPIGNSQGALKSMRKATHNPSVAASNLICLMEELAPMSYR